MSRISLFCRLALGMTASLAAFGGTLLEVPSTTPCASSSLSSLVALGSDGCSIGEFTFFNFSFLRIATLQPNSQSLLANASDITVNFPNKAQDSLEFLSTKFDVKAGDRVQYLIGYTLDPPPPILPGFELDLFTDTPVAPGLATVTANICVGGIFFFNSPNQCLDVGAPGYVGTPYTAQVFHLGSTKVGSIKLKDQIFFDSPTNLIDVRILIDLDARLGGSSQVRGIGSGASPIPEPATYALVGAGLLAAAFLSRRRS